MRFRDLKTGVTYEIMGVAPLITNGPVGEGDEMVIYRNLDDGRLITQPAAEFYDGRYAPVGDGET